MSAIELFGEMISTINIHHHTECQDIYRWPRYHNDLLKLKESDVYQQTRLLKAFSGKLRQTRLTSKEGTTCMATNVYDDVAVRLKRLSEKLYKELKAGVFDEKTVAMLDLTRKIADVASMTDQIKEHGHISFGVRKSKEFLNAVRGVTSKLDDIPDEQIDIAFKQFFRKLEQYELNTKDSKEIIKDFLDKENGYYTMDLK